MRLQRFLAAAGIASRRRSEDLILAGLVTVNGDVVTQPGQIVDPDVDRVTYREQVVSLPARRSVSADRCLLFHKPAGVVTTREDPGGRKTVYNYVSEPVGTRLIYVGRLDRDTEGVLLFTFDGELAHRLTHPRWQIPRRYRVDATPDLDPQALARSSTSGLQLEDGPTAPYRLLQTRAGRGGVVVVLELVEGKNREVRRMIEACGGTVRRLVRTHFAFLSLDGVPVGAHRHLSSDEEDRLYALVEMKPGVVGEVT